jgi:hypothetical protein
MKPFSLSDVLGINTMEDMCDSEPVDYNRQSIRGAS